MSEKFHGSLPEPREAKVPHLVVAIGVVGDGEDGDDVVLAEQAHQGGHRWVVLHLVLGVGARGVQVALLVITPHDAGQHVGPVGLVVEGRLGGENQQVGAVGAPADVPLGRARRGVPVEQAATSQRCSPSRCRHVLTRGSARTRDSQPP